ncbi:GFA family protein [Oricola cellulosilytica]|uniref:GFA family protein n=1 Tax=Oricola cellulosilytica TaxID=1429082 RepID=A0A4R0PFK9_9HYPH|nr:GFA family protein [Oricola cellulosilytica]TCD15448.1 GFA family protein [Oricola cellulosilytica]
MAIFLQQGGCQCRAVRYTLKSRPLVVYVCHCTECQKQSSSAFGESVRVRAADLEIGGEIRAYIRPSSSGEVRCEFCPECGTRLFHRRASYSEHLNIKGGSFDETSWLVPAGHIWTASRQPWVSIPRDALTYERQPESYDRMIARYASGP